MSAKRYEFASLLSICYTSYLSNSLLQLYITALDSFKQRLHTGSLPSAICVILEILY